LAGEIHWDGNNKGRLRMTSYGPLSGLHTIVEPKYNEELYFNQIEYLLSLWIIKHRYSVLRERKVINQQVVLSPVNQVQDRFDRDTVPHCEIASWEK